MKHSLPAIPQPVKIAIVVSEFNRLFTERLHAAATRTLFAAGVSAESVETHWVAGAFELPIAFKWIATSGRYSGGVALSCVIAGETNHDEYISNHAITGLGRVSIETGFPISLGVLTVETQEQAFARVGGKHGNKGTEAAEALLSLLALRENISPGAR